MSPPVNKSRRGPYYYIAALAIAAAVFTIALLSVPSAAASAVRSSGRFAINALEKASLRNWIAKSKIVNRCSISFVA